MIMTQEDKKLLFKDLCARLPYKIRVKVSEVSYPVEFDVQMLAEIKNNNWYEYPIPYLRSMSGMTEEEKKELLCVIVGKDAVKYFQVLADGSIDNTDAAHQDLHNFTMHWINFDGSNITSYIDWLNAHHFDYRDLISKGLALEAPKDMYNF